MHSSFSLSRLIASVVLVSVAAATVGDAYAVSRSTNPQRSGRATGYRYDPLLSLPKKPKTPTEKAPSLPPPPELKRWYFNYFAEFSGPSADFALPLESYSFGADYYAPMKIYQSVNLGYNLSWNHRIGIEQGTDLPLQSEVLNAFDNYYSSDFVFYDPNLYFQYFNLFSNPYSWVNGKVSLDLPISDNSKKNKYITGLYNGYVWNFRLDNPKFYFGLNFDFWLFFFQEMLYWNRFSSSVGHNWGWYISNQWSLDTVTVFDFALRSQGNNNYQFVENSVDRLKVTLRFQPIPNTWQFGAFFQLPLYKRQLSRSAVGLNMDLWF